MLFRIFGALLFLLCGWLAGDAVRQKTDRHLRALEQTLLLFQRLRQEIYYRRTDLQQLYFCLQQEELVPAAEAVYSSFRRRMHFLRKNSVYSKNVSPVLAGPKQIRNVNGWSITLQDFRIRCIRRRRLRRHRLGCRKSWVLQPGQFWRLS